MFHPGRRRGTGTPLHRGDDLPGMATRSLRASWVAEDNSLMVNTGHLPPGKAGGEGPEVEEAQPVGKNRRRRLRRIARFKEAEAADASTERLEERGRKSQV